jgi:hypothetical protein
MRELTVNVEGLIFSGMRGPFAIGPDGFDGWDDGVEMRVTDTPRPQAHGSYDLPVYGGSRIINISGYALAKSVDELDQLGDRLTGLLAGGQKGRIAVTKNGRTRWTDCRLATQTKFTERHGQATGDFQVQLWCADGRKYGESNDFEVANGSPGTVYHRGNFPATPKIVVRGEIANGYTVTVDGWNYAVSKALQTGKPHRIEYSTGRLYVDGVLTQNSLGNTNLTNIPPGKSVGFGLYPTSGGSGTATMTLLDTYI